MTVYPGILLGRVKKTHATKSRADFPKRETAVSHATTPLVPWESNKQIKEEKIRLRRVCAENIAKEKRKLIARKARECVQRRKEAAKKAEEEETQQEQDRNDRAIALRLFKKHYKDEFDKRGRSVARHR